MFKITSQHETPDSKPGQAVETSNSLLSFDKLRMRIDDRSNLNAQQPDLLKKEGGMDCSKLKIKLFF